MAVKRQTDKEGNEYERKIRKDQVCSAGSARSTCSVMAYWKSGINSFTMSSSSPLRIIFSTSRMSGQISRSIS